MRTWCMSSPRCWGFCTLLVAIVAGGVLHASAEEQEPEPQRPVESVKAELRWRDPAVELVEGSRPSTPDEWIEVARILARLDRPDLAKGYLKKVLQSDLDQAQLIELAEHFGPAAFSRMAMQKDLLPEAGKLADAVLSAVRQQRGSVERLTELVGQLQSPDERTRDKAVTALRKAAPAAVAPLVAVLADPNRATEHARVRRVLAGLGGDATRPLLAYLESSDPMLVTQVIAVLADARAGDSSLYLLAPYASPDSDPTVRAAARAALGQLVDSLPTPGEAAGVLARRGRRYFDGRATIRQDENGQATVWHWDPNQGKAVAKTYSADVARAVLAARLAGQALSIAPNDAEIRRLYLLTTLEAASQEAGLDRPLPQGPGTPAARAAEFGTAELLAVLDEAMKTGHGPAATAAARILGHSATADAVLAVGPNPSPLVRALRSGDRRTRAAAVEALVRLKPAKSFPGASYLAESMAFLASSTGKRRAMVAAPSTVEARRVGGHLSGLGYEVDTAVTGREMIKQLIESPDYELVFVDGRIDRPPIGILLQQLRRDGRTASLPVGILGTEGSYQRADKAARDDRLALSFVRPHDGRTVRWQVERLEKLAGRSAAGAELRRRQAAQTLQRLAQLHETSPGLFDLRRVEHAVLGALWTPELSGDAVGVLEKLGTPESQRALVDLASNRTQPLELRKAALSALINSVQQHGILLTTGEILLQYDRYNQSATADSATQKILGRVLDCLEARSKTVGSRQRAEGRGQKSGD